MQTNRKKQNIKSYIAIAIFLVFWMIAFADLFFEEKVAATVPNFSWAYHQAFHQTWSFFSQPAIYNDKLVFILRKNDKVIDSIDVLDELWKTKRSKWNYAKENVWDHIMFRNLRDLRKAIQNKTFFKVVEIKKEFTEHEIIESKENAILLNNLIVFGTTVLKEKGIEINNCQYQIILITNYTKPFYNHQHYNDTTIQLTTDWQQFSKWKN